MFSFRLLKKGNFIMNVLMIDTWETLIMIHR